METINKITINLDENIVLTGQHYHELCKYLGVTFPENDNSIPLEDDKEFEVEIEEQTKFILLTMSKNPELYVRAIWGVRRFTKLLAFSTPHDDRKLLQGLNWIKDDSTYLIYVAQLLTMLWG